MNPIRILLANALAAALALASPAGAGVVFSESFEAPVVTGFVQNTVPSGGKWVGSTTGFGATNRGLYNETVAWPATPPFTTPYGAQAYCCSYTNSFLTTATGATGQTLTANVPYKVTFNTAVDTSVASANFRVELLASGTLLASTTGTVTTKDMSAVRSLTFTPDGANAHLGKDVGIRLVFSNARVLYDNIRLITGHDMNPSPATGVVMSSGNTVLSWTNMPPNTPGGNVPVDVFFGTDPAALTQVVDGVLTSTTSVNAPVASTYYWRVDSYPDGNPNGTPVTGDLFSFIVIDTDGDGFPDTYELANTDPPSSTALEPSTDLDVDGLTAIQEYNFGTNPTDNDTDNDTLLDGPEMTGVGLRPATIPVDFDSDDDGLSDGAESNTGLWTSASNTGTNPRDNDKDKDGLLDGAETNTGTVVSKNNAGTNPHVPDTDGDGAGDYYEVVACFTSPFNANDKPRVPYPLPDPDASPGVTNKPVKVYIMSGQSNMVGLGNVYGTDDKSLETMTLRQNKFPNLVNEAGGWTQRQDVRYRGVISAIHNKGLTPGCGASSNNLGPELGFGHIMGWYHDEPVLLLKSSIGNRSLSWDILPPGAAGYGLPIPTTPGAWYGGKQYDIYFKDESQWAHPDAAVTNVVDVLDNFAAQYPGWATQGFEIAGFVWWQGERDLGVSSWAAAYEQNLVTLIDSLRSYYTTRYRGKVATNAPFVLGTLGEATLEMTTPANGVAVRDAHLAVDSTTGSNPQINVKTVYTNPLSEGGEGNNHYLNRAGTYMLVGDAMGRAMVDLLVAASGPDVTPPTPSPMSFATAPTAVNTSTVGMVATTAVDASESVQYWFENTSNSTNSGWITSTRWDSTGLTDGVSQDFRVKAKDSAGNETAFSAVFSAAPGNDVTKPTPDPMTFAGPLQVLGENSISMAANTASDINGVQYEFVCTVGGGPGSGWQSSPSFTATGLTPGTSYTYIVRAKDPAGNTTTDSAPVSASTIAPDTTPPSPATSSFITPPTALGIDVISMTATTTTDPSGVEYYFEETTGNPGAADSGWQNSPTYTNSGLQPGTEYSYRVRARDKSPAQNVSNWSSAASATTGVPDTTEPLVVSLNPTNGASNVGINGNLIITFDESVVIGTGNITLKNLTDATQTNISVTDTTQVTVSGAVLTINPTAALLLGNNYAVQIPATAIGDLAENNFAGILNDTTWNFTVAAVEGEVWIYDGADATNNTWTTAGSWSGGTIANGSNSTANFNLDFTADRTITLGGNRTIGNINFTDTASSHNLTISGNTLTLDLTSGRPAVHVSQSDRSLSIDSIIAGSDGLNKSGAGTLILTAANTYTGGTTINAGTLQLGNGGSTGSIANTAILNNGSLVINRTGAAQGLGAITGTGSVTLTNGTGLALSGGNSFSGGFNLNGGSLAGFATGNFNGFGSGTLTIGSGASGTWTMPTSSATTIPNAIQWNRATTNFNRSGSSGVGLVTFDGNVTLGQSITLNQSSSTVQVNFVFNGNISDGGSGYGLSVTGTQSGSLTLNGTNTFTGPMSVKGLAIGGSGSLGGGSFAGNITASSGLTYSSSVHQILSGTNSITGLTTVSAGTLQFAKTASLTSSATNRLNVKSGATLALSVGGTGEFSTANVATVLTNQAASTGATNGMNAGSNFGFDTTNASGASFTIGNVIANSTGTGGGARGLTKLGTGTLVLSVSNTYTGLTQINGGTLLITGAAQSTSAITFGGGSLGLDIATPVTAASATVNFTGQTVLVTGTPTLASHTLLTAGSITGTPTLAVPISGYTLQVVSNQLRLVAGSANPYDTWAGPGVAFDADANNDGVDNGMAWVLGAATPAENALNKLPVATRNGANLRLNFRCLKSTKRGGVVLKVQSSNDMGVSNPWTSIEAAVPDTDSTVNRVVFDTTADGDFINVIADIPADGAKLFGRLSAVNAP